RVGERTKFSGHATGNRCRFAAGLEAGEVRTIAPGERSTQSDAGLDRGIMNNVDRAFVIRSALPVAAKISKISAGSEAGCDAGNFRDRVRVLEPFKCF